MEIGFIGALVLLLASCGIVGWQIMVSNKVVRDIKDRKRDSDD